MTIIDVPAVVVVVKMVIDVVVAEVDVNEDDVVVDVGAIVDVVAVVDVDIVVVDEAAETFV